jgi:hypothetical protein
MPKRSWQLFRLPFVWRPIFQDTARYNKRSNFKQQEKPYFGRRQDLQGGISGQRNFPDLEAQTKKAQSAPDSIA